MKQFLTLNLLLGFFFISFAQQLPSLPVGVGAGSSEVWNNEIYHFGGWNTWNGPTVYPRVYKFGDTNWAYHDTIPDNNVWDFTTTVVGYFVYMFEGYPSGTGLCRRYNLLTGNWTYLANSPNVFANYGLTSEEVDSIIYLFNLPGHVYAYNIITNSWTTKTSNTVSGSGDLSSVKYQDEVYIRGWNNNGFYKYTPSSDSWIQLADLPYQVNACGMGIVNNLIYCIGGNDGGGAAADYQTIIVYNIDTNSWTTDPLQLSSKRHWMASAEYLGGLYVLGGFDELGNGVSSVEEIVPQGTSGISSDGEIPFDYSLYQNFPNPFNPSTTIKFSIPTSEFTTLKVFDVLGNEVATLLNEEKPAGSYEVNFDAKGLSSGIYFYKLQTGSFVKTKKMQLLK